MNTINKLKKIQADLDNPNINYDAESAHGDADGVLCDFLRELGYGEIVREYEEIDRWYG